MGRDRNAEKEEKRKREDRHSGKGKAKLGDAIRPVLVADKI